MATESCRPSNTVSVSLWTVGHCDESKRHGSGNDGMERRRRYVLFGKCTGTMDRTERMDQIWCENFAREGTVHVVDGLSRKRREQKINICSNASELIDEFSLFSMSENLLEIFNVLPLLIKLISTSSYHRHRIVVKNTSCIFVHWINQCLGHSKSQRKASDEFPKTEKKTISSHSRTTN